MDRTWTKVGAKCFGRLIDADDGAPYRKVRLSRKRVVAAIERFKWQEIPCELAIMPAEAIKATIKEFNLRGATHVAVTNELAPYGFYGIRARYKGGYGELFVLDTGTAIIPLVSDFYKEEAA